MTCNEPALERRAILAADRAAIAEALWLTHEFLGAAGLGDDAGVRLAVIVEELVANIIEHGDLPPGAKIELTLRRDAGSAVLTLADPGAPFDPCTVALAAETPERGGGAGLALVRAWSRAMAYRRVDGRNLLRLEISATS